MARTKTKNKRIRRKGNSERKLAGQKSQRDLRRNGMNPHRYEKG